MEETQNKEQTKAPKKIIKKKKIISSNPYGGYGTGYGSGYGGGSYGAGGYGGGGYGGGGYGGYGNYGSMGYGPSGGYGGARPEESQANRTIGDYISIMKERIWYIITTFTIIVVGILLYTFQVTPIYTSMASVQILRDSDSPIDGMVASNGSRNDIIASTEDFNTQVKIMESFEIIRAVKSRMKADEMEAFMAPFNDMFSFTEKKTEEEVLASSRQIVPERMSLIVRILFSHPNASTAARMANLFASEFINFNHQNKVQKIVTSIDDLRSKIAQQVEKVQELEKKMVAYREKHGAISLDAEDNIARSELEQLNSIVTSNRLTYDAASTQWNLVQDFIREKKSLVDLPFIAISPQIAKILSESSTQQVIFAALEKRYKEKHPKIIEVKRVLDQYKKELEIATKSEVQKIYATYETTKKNYEVAAQRLAEKETDMLDLSKKSIEYKELQRQHMLAETMQATLIVALNKLVAEVSLIKEGANILDRAMPSIRPSSPNYIINIIIAIVAGLGGGIGMAFLIAMIDDRAKSIHDIESYIGIPLLSVVPRIKRLNSSQKAQIAASNADMATMESFRALHSTMKVNSLARNAKVILTTSTTPSEGKSFVVSNLAFTCAMHGERTIILDADLRLPAIAKVLDIKAKVGLNSYIEGKSDLDSCITKDFYPNLDVLVCEKHSSNPTQAINSTKFISLIDKLRDDYDRIFIDSPPIGVVSDAIALLPKVDGVLYVVKYNAVMRKTIKNCIKKMMNANVPVLGAVLNMVTKSKISKYNISYYDRNAQAYYHSAPLEAEEGTQEVEEGTQETK